MAFTDLQFSRQFGSIPPGPRIEITKEDAVGVEKALIRKSFARTQGFNRVCQIGQESDMFHCLDFGRIRKA